MCDVGGETQGKDDAVKVRTDGDGFAVLEHGQAMVELSKDGDSPSCPSSWTWTIWFDGNCLDGSCDETSLAQGVKESIESLELIVKELSGLKDYLRAYGAFGGELRNGLDGEGAGERVERNAADASRRPKVKPILASQRDGVAFYLDDSAVCGYCGKPLTRPGIPCPLNYVWQNFCPYCGTEIDKRRDEEH